MSTATKIRCQSYSDSRSPKDIKLSIRVSKEEKAIMQQMADAKGISLSNLLISTLFTSVSR